MAHGFVRAALLVGAASVGLAGCANSPGLGGVLAGGPHISDKVWMTVGETPKSDPTAAQGASQASGAAATDYGSENYMPAVCKIESGVTELGIGTDGKDDSNKKEEVNLCVDAMVGVIDNRWEHFKGTLVAVVNGTNATLDFTSIAIGGVGTFAGGATAQALNAVGAAVTGAKSTFDQDILLKNEITNVVNQMITDRTAAYATIVKAETSDTGYASMRAAQIDLQAYADAGSWSHALTSLANTTSASADACKKKRASLQVDKTAKRAPKTTESTTAGSSICSDAATSSPAAKPDSTAAGDMADAHTTSAALKGGATAAQAKAAGESARKKAVDSVRANRSLSDSVADAVGDAMSDSTLPKSVRAIAEETRKKTKATLETTEH